MNKSLYMTAMNMVRDDCERCPYNKCKGKCPSEKAIGDIVKNGAVLAVCAKTMYHYLQLMGKPKSK